MEEKKLFDVVLRFSESGEDEITTECVTVVDGQQSPIEEVVDSSEKAFMVVDGLRNALVLFAGMAVTLMEKEGNIDEATAAALRSGKYKG